MDVFYGVSRAFSSRGLLVREVEKRGSISLAGFYARRARRLLPAAALVIVAVLLASAILFSPTRQELVIGDAVASSLYYVNWRFVAQSADYFGPPDRPEPASALLVARRRGAVLSRFAAFLLLGVAYLWMRSGRPMPRAAAASAIGAVTVVSFTYSALYEPTSTGEAFFFRLSPAPGSSVSGASLAFLPATRLRPTPAAVLGFAGLGAIVLATLIFSPSTRFPGVAALLPCLGAAAIIRAGRADMPFRPLTLRPVRYVGKISYSWYLWHWPPLIFFATEFGPLGQGGHRADSGLVCSRALTHHLIERPMQRSSMLEQMPARFLAVGAACMVVGLVAAGAVAVSLPDFGARVGTRGGRGKGRQNEPSGDGGCDWAESLDAALDKGQLSDDGCLVERPILESGKCTYGPDDESANVFLLGDSHGQQYFPALQRIGRDKDWQITGLTKVGCTPASISVWSGSLKGPYPECDEWRENSLRRMEEGDPDLVVVSSASYYHVDDDGDKLGHLPSRPLLSSAYEETLNRLLATGAEVVVMVDIPQAPFNVSDCVWRTSTHSRSALPGQGRRQQDPLNLPRSKRSRKRTRSRSSG